MEKLIDLKQEWCKWKCPDDGSELCDTCQIENFVTFVRNEGGR